MAAETKVRPSTCAEARASASATLSIPRAETDSRAKGHQFTTNKQRRGQTGDNWNKNQTGGRRTDHKILYEGEPYVEAHTHERKWKLEQNKKNLTPEGFKSSSPNRRAASRELGAA